MLPSPLLIVILYISIQCAKGIDKGTLSNSYRLRAKIAWQQEDRDKAIFALHEAMRLAELQRTQFSGAAQDHANAFSSFGYTYELMVAYQTILGNVPEVFSTMERGRAKSLLDQLAVSGTDLLAGLPADEAAILHKRDVDAKSRLASLEQQLKVNGTRIDYSDEKKIMEGKRLRGEIIKAREELVASYQSIRNASPAYRLSMSMHNTPVALKQLQAEITSQQGLLLEYLVGTESSFVLAIPSQGKAKVFPLMVTEKQAKLLGIKTGPVTQDILKVTLSNTENTGVLDLLKNQALSDDAVPHLAELWNILIPEELQQSLTDDSVKRLMIIPDGPLALLPFEALVVEDEANEPTYFIDVGPSMLYSPSATVLYNLSQRNDVNIKQQTKPVLSIGDPAYPQKKQAPTGTALDSISDRGRFSTLTTKLSRLPHTSIESSLIKEIFSEAGLKTTQYLESQATEANLRKDISGRKYLHLACHGLTDHSHSNFFGALALMPGISSENTLDNDGFLTLAEIYELDLKGCELAILSACETNFGPQKRGEGVWSLSRGFLVAGTRRVVASNWLVDDEAAASMMSYYCGYLALAEKDQKQPDYAESLHSARRWVREQNKWSSPYYWASFVHIGPR